MAQISIVKKSELEGAMRLDAEYYQPKYLQLNKSLMLWKGGNVKRLSAIGTVEYGFRPMEDYASQDEGEPLIRVTNILGNLLVDMNDVKFIRKGLASNRKRVKHGDILVVQCGDTTGKVAFISNELDNLVFPSFCLRVRTQELVPEYLAAFLNSRLGQLQIMRGITYATVRPNTTKPNIQNILVPIPSEEIQHQVATAASSAFAETKQSKVLYLQAERLLLDEVGFKNLDLSHQLYYTVPYKGVKEARRLDAEHFQPKYKHLIQHVIKVGRYAKLQDILKEPVQKGITPQYDLDGNIIIVNSQHLGRYCLNIESTNRTTQTFWQQNKRAQIKPKDVLFYATGAYIGRTNIWPVDYKAMAGVDILLVRPSEACNPYYLSVYLNSPLGFLQAEKFASGSGQRHIYPTDIARFVVYLPSMEFQQRIADLVIQSWEARQKARQLLEEAKRRVEEMIEMEAGR